MILDEPGSTYQLLDYTPSINKSISFNRQGQGPKDLGDKSKGCFRFILEWIFTKFYEREEYQDEIKMWRMTVFDVFGNCYICSK